MKFIEYFKRKEKKYVSKSLIEDILIQLTDEGYDYIFMKDISKLPSKIRPGRNEFGAKNILLFMDDLEKWGNTILIFKRDRPTTDEVLPHDTSIKFIEDINPFMIIVKDELTKRGVLSRMLTISEILPLKRWFLDRNRFADSDNLAAKWLLTSDLGYFVGLEILAEVI